MTPSIEQPHAEGGEADEDQVGQHDAGEGEGGMPGGAEGVDLKAKGEQADPNERDEKKKEGE